MNLDFKKRYNLLLEKFQQKSPSITKDYQYFLAGFIEGEGSISISVKQNKGKYKVDPEFNVCQHKNGIIHLLGIMSLFRTGNISFKSGSKATYIYKITNRRLLEEKFIPFYRKFIWPYACESKRKTFSILCEVIKLFNQKVHLTPKGLALHILPLVYQMNSSKGKARKWTLEELQQQILKDS